jgi:outer membrane immunogenic protein
MNSDGIVGGIHGGYNWQFAPQWVAGIEADISWSGIRANSSARLVPTGGCPVNCDVFMRNDAEFLGTVRARLGHAWDRWLVYATGGYAYGRMKYDGDTVVGTVIITHYATGTVSTTKSGWTIGGGIEHALAGNWSNWTVKGEYLYYNFGDFSAVGSGPAPFGQRYTWDDAFHVVRAGLSYKFGAPGGTRY